MIKGTTRCSNQALAVEKALATLDEKVADGGLRNPETTGKHFWRFPSKVAIA